MTGSWTQSFCSSVRIQIHGLSATSSYSFGATALIFCRMFIHIMEVCMPTGFSSNIHNMTGSWTQSFCSSVRIQIHGLSGYLLLQFWSYSFNILYDVYTHNGGVHVHSILMVRRGGGIICVLQTHFIFKKSLLTKQLCP